MSAKRKQQNTKQNWHILASAETLKRLRSDKEEGLSHDEVEKRRRVHGKNALPTKKKFSGIILFLVQFNNILIYILMVAAVVSMVLGENIDAYIIIAAILVNVFVGFIQEFKAQTALAKLSRVVKSYCIVIREGKQNKITTSELVPGDIVILNAGNNVPADCRIFESKNLQIDEASLTGESLPVDKNSMSLKKANQLLAQRTNMAYMGSLVTRGRAYAVVVETGLQTEIGQIAELIKETESEKTPLQKNLEVFSRNLGVLIITVCLFIFVAGILAGRPFVEMFTVAVAAAVSAIPEGLVIAVTVILAIGMQRILKKHALVRKLVAAETLGSTNVICSDKTGTITMGTMIAQSVITLDKVYEASKINKKVLEKSSGLEKLFQAAVMANNAVLENPKESKDHQKYIGAPTEIAMLKMYYDAGLDPKFLYHKMPEIDEDPFNSKRKYQVSLHTKSETKNIIFVSGAAEKLLEMSSFVMGESHKKDLTDKDRAKLLELHEKNTRKGLRLVGLAYKSVDSKSKKLNNSQYYDFTFLGFIVIKDPIRPNVKHAIVNAQKAGIRTVMITGDHKNTAYAIAHELGLVHSEDEVYSGAELDELNDQDLEHVVEKASVYARVTPHDKLRIIDALQARGHVVAMTGDGINDAPALKAADIGIAVGNGTDVTKGVADIVLLDNNFKTIVTAIKEGRVIVDNIKKVVVYLLADAFSAMVLILGAILIGLPLPITASQILWINLITDGFPYMALTMEKSEKDVMKLKPIKKGAGILDSEMKAVIFIIGIATDIILMGLFWYYYKSTGDLQMSRTIIFAALGIYTLMYSFSCKSLRKPLWKINIFDNKYLVLAVVSGALIHLFALYNPFMRDIFKLGVMTPQMWLIILPLGVVKILGIELVKSFFIGKK